MSLLDDIKDYPSSQWGKSLAPDHVKTIRNLPYQARQFIFDEEASYSLGHFILNCPDVIADNLEFVVPPYDVTYVEYDLFEMNKAIKRPTTADYIPLNDADHKLGMLYADGCLYELVSSKNHPRGVVAPFGAIDRRYVTRSRGFPDLPEEAEAASQLMLGSTYQDLGNKKAIKFHDRFAISAYCLDEDVKKNLEFITAGAGSVRDYVAALLLLYQRKHVTIMDKPAFRMISRGKSRAYMAHSVVSISLEAEQKIHRAFTVVDRHSPRRHEVRTHYAHRRTDFKCVHSWTAADDDHWNCSLCGGLRWLRRSHLRGDASIGFVTKEYKVTA